MGWVGFNPRRIFLQYAGSVAPSKSGGRSRSARVEKFTCAAVTPNLIPSPPPNLIPSPPLHSTAPSDHRRPAPSPASPPGLRSAGLAQRRPRLVRRADPTWSAAPEEPPRRARGAAPPASRSARGAARPPASAPDRLRISARVAPPSASPRHLPRTGARSALCPGSLQVSTGLVLFCCYFFIAIS